MTGKIRKVTGNSRSQIARKYRSSQPDPAPVHTPAPEPMQPPPTQAPEQAKKVPEATKKRQTPTFNKKSNIRTTSLGLRDDKLNLAKRLLGG